MIRYQNVYHMLAYAFRTLGQNGYRDMATEDFPSAADMLAEILARSVEVLVKRGLARDYVELTEELTLPRGKIEMGESLRRRSQTRRRLTCTHDEYSLDTIDNRTIKATLLLLLSSDVERRRKRVLRSLLPHFSDVTDVDPRPFRKRAGVRRDETQDLAVAICRLVWEGLLQTQRDGCHRLADFIDEQRMCQLFERFVLRYYQREHPWANASAPHIPWATDDERLEMLPTMRSDVVLSRGNASLILDAKYYSHTTQERFGVRSVHSANVYQMFAYVKNAQAALGRDHTVSGLILYAATDEDVLPEASWSIAGNEIGATTLDLDRPFADIRAGLDSIAFGLLGA